MNTLITLCRDIEEPTSADCGEDHEATDVTLVAPCKVARDKCAPSAVNEPLGAEAESSATRQGEMVIADCCDC
jgi:hypothetical protein